MSDSNTIDAPAQKEDKLLAELSAMLELAKEVIVMERTSVTLLDGVRMETVRSEEREVSGESVQSEDLLQFGTARALSSLAERLKPIVLSDSRFPGNVALNMHSPGWRMSFYPAEAIKALLLRVLQTGDPMNGIQWLLKVLSTKEASGSFVTALWGVSVEKAAQLTRDVRIVPVDTLPDTHQKRWLKSWRPDNDRTMSPFGWKPPESALVVAYTHPFVCDASQPHVALSSRRKIDEVTLPLTAVGLGAPIPLAHWTTLDDPDLEAAVSGKVRVRPSLEVLPKLSVTHPALNPVEARKIVEGYLALQGTVQDKVRVALQRLRLSRLRHDEVGDRAIELSIAFETLMGDGAKTEMTHKVKVRTARLLGGPVEERRTNAKIVGEMYSIRSTQVHQGKVDVGKTENIAGVKMTKVEIVSRATTILADLVRVIIRRGAIPDWQDFDVAPNE